jgi:hypothetical protein
MYKRSCHYLEGLLNRVKKIIIYTYESVTFAFPPLRLVSKFRLLKSYRVPTTSLDAIKFCIFSRELDTFTYSIANIDELTRTLSGYFKTDRTIQENYVSEIENYSKNLSGVLRFSGGREIGRHMFVYCAIRNIKPDIVIELGVKEGLGTLCIIQALDMNNSGKVISVDNNPTSGRLIRKLEHIRLNFYIEDSVKFMSKLNMLSGVVIVISDSSNDINHIEAEWQNAINTSTGSLYFQHNLGWSNLVPDKIEKNDYMFFKEQAKHLFYPGRGSYIGKIK